MGRLLFTDPQSLLYIIPSVLIALSFHEFAHAYAANAMGDPTAKNLGRMTVNPLAHIDFVGFLLLVIVGFGWAKPVPVNPRNYRNYKKGEIIVSLAGVTANLILALLGSLGMMLVLKFGANAAGNAEMLYRLYTFFRFFTYLNCALFAFNLFPIYPLDGFHVAEMLFAKYTGPSVFLWIRSYGSFLLIACIVVFNGLGISPWGWLASSLMQGINALTSLIL